MTTIIKKEMYKAENNVIFVEQYQNKWQQKPLWRYGYITYNGAIVVSEGLLSRPRKQTLLNIFGGKELSTLE